MSGKIIARVRERQQAAGACRLEREAQEEHEAMMRAAYLNHMGNRAAAEKIYQTIIYRPRAQDAFAFADQQLEAYMSVQRPIPKMP